jgi:hypothetical protein
MERGADEAVPVALLPEPDIAAVAVRALTETATTAPPMP